MTVKSQSPQHAPPGQSSGPSQASSAAAPQPPGAPQASRVGSPGWKQHTWPAAQGAPWQWTTGAAPPVDAPVLAPPLPLPDGRSTELPHAAARVTANARMEEGSARMAAPEDTPLQGPSPRVPL